jgi:hypothetical protein
MVLNSTLKSGLAASVAAQLYSFFNDPQNYTHPMADGRKPLASCREDSERKCPQYHLIAFACYIAVALNLAAAVTAFILIDWKAKQAAKSRFVSDFMVNVGHVGCMKLSPLSFSKIADHLVLQGFSPFILAFSWSFYQSFDTHRSRGG